LLFRNNSVATTDIKKNSAQTFKQEDCKSSSKTKTTILSSAQDKSLWVR